MNTFFAALKRKTLTGQRKPVPITHPMPFLQMAKHLDLSLPLFQQRLPVLSSVVQLAVETPGCISLICRNEPNRVEARIESADITVGDRDILLEFAIEDKGLRDGNLVDQRIQQPRHQLFELPVLDEQICHLFSQGALVFLFGPDLLISGNLSLDNFLLVLILYHHTVEVVSVDLAEEVIFIKVVQQFVQIGEPFFKAV